MPKSAFYLFPRWAAISSIAVFVVFAGMGIRLVSAEFIEPTCVPPGCNRPGTSSAILSNTATPAVPQTIETPLTIGGTTPRDLSLYGNLKMLSPNTSIIRSETLTGKAIDVGSLDNFTINASSSGSGKYALFANGVGSTGGVMAKTDSGKAIEAISTGTGLAALLQGAVQIGSDTTSGETTIGTQANNANLNVYGDILVNGKLLAGSGSVVQKVLPEFILSAATPTKVFLRSDLFGAGDNYTLTSFKAYSTPSGTFNTIWNPVAAGEISYLECNVSTGVPEFKLTITNSTPAQAKKYRVVYAYSSDASPCAPDSTPPIASAPINTVQILKSGTISTSTIQSNEAGNIYLVKNGTSATTQTQIDSAITAHNAFIGKSGAVANTAYTVTVPLASLINDGVYNIVAVDNATNVSTPLAGWLTVDNTAPTTCSINYPGEGISISGAPTVNFNLADNYGIGKVELYLDGSATVRGTDTASPWGIYFDTGNPMVTNGSHTLKAKCYDIAGNSMMQLDPPRTINVLNTGVACPSGSTTSFCQTSLVCRACVDGPRCMSSLQDCPIIIIPGGS